MKKLINYAITFSNRYTECRVPRASAALAYFFTLTFFPLVICLYYVLGPGEDSVVKLADYLKTMLAPETVGTIVNFIKYVEANKSPAMAVVAFMVLMTSAATAVRNIQFSIGDIQGKMRFKQLPNYLLSFCISLIFLFVSYVSAFVLLSGRAVVEKINELLPLIDISRSWYYLRFIILIALLPGTLYGVYWMCRDKGDKYSLWPGVIVSTIGTMAVCFIFTVFIGASMRYPLVYGSMASIILLMMWIYFFAISMYSGAVINVMVRDERRKIAEERSES